MYTEDEVEAAMCLWEEMLRLLALGSDAPKFSSQGDRQLHLMLKKQQREEGMASMRQRCIRLARSLEADYKDDVLEGITDKDSSFDWEYVPLWLSTHLYLHGQLA